MEGARPNPSGRVPSTGVPTVARSATGWLYLGVFSSAFDRYVVPPMLLAIAASFGTSVGEAAGILTAYLVVSALLQMPWGMAADRFGRRAALQASCWGSAVGGVVCALAPSLPALTAGRVLVAVAGAGIIGNSIVVAGEGGASGVGHHAIARVLAVISVSTSVALLAGGLIADTVGWRVGFVLPALAAAAVALAASRAVPADASPGRVVPDVPLRAVLRHRWVRIIVGVGMLDGAALLGVLAYLAPAVEASGSSASLAGATVSTVGLSTMACTMLVRSAGRVLRPPALILLGGGALVAAYAVAAADQRPLAVLASALLVGFAFPFLHSTVQAWAAEVLPGARATVTGIFGTGLLLGAAVATAALAPLADGGDYGVLFTAGAAAAAVTAAVAALLRRHFEVCIT